MDKSKKDFFSIVYYLLYIPSFLTLSIIFLRFYFQEGISNNRIPFSIISYFLLSYYPLITGVYLYWGIKFKVDIYSKWFISSVFWFLGCLLLIITFFAAFASLRWQTLNQKECNNNNWIQTT
jgi:hypothetical protein